MTARRLIAVIVMLIIAGGALWLIDRRVQRATDRDSHDQPAAQQPQADVVE
jgi:hypothetical protein